MTSILKSVLLAALCVVALGACASHGQVRGVASVGGTTYYPSGSSGTVYYYQSRPLFQPYYRYRTYPGYRVHPTPRYYHDRTWRGPHRHYRQPPRHWRGTPHRPGTRPNRPDRVQPAPPVRRPGIRAPLRVEPIERRQVK